MLPYQQCELKTAAVLRNYPVNKLSLRSGVLTNIISLTSVFGVWPSLLAILTTSVAKFTGRNWQANLQAEKQKSFYLNEKNCGLPSGKMCLSNMKCFENLIVAKQTDKHTNKQGYVVETVSC